MQSNARTSTLKEREVLTFAPVGEEVSRQFRCAQTAATKSGQVSSRSVGAFSVVKANGATSGYAYGALLEIIQRELDGQPSRQAVRVPPERKRDALMRLEQSRGLEGVEALGRRVCQLHGHPFVSALSSCREPATLLRTWERLEVFAHSTHRVRVLAVEAQRVEVERRGGGSAAEDRFILGVIAGFLEELGCRPVMLEGAGTQWTLRWASQVKPAAVKTTVPIAWGAPGDFARGALLTLMAEERMGMRALAKRLAVSTRTLQRRLSECGTSFRELSAVARVAQAGRRLEQEPSLSTVAHACGFADSAHFSREFKRHIGIPPSWFVRATRR